MHPDLCHMGGVGVPVRAGGAPAASVWRRGGVGCNQLDREKEKGEGAEPGVLENVQKASTYFKLHCSISFFYI